VRCVFDDRVTQNEINESLGFICCPSHFVLFLLYLYKKLYGHVHEIIMFGKGDAVLTKFDYQAT